MDKKISDYEIEQLQKAHDQLFDILEETGYFKENKTHKLCRLSTITDPLWKIAFKKRG